MDYFPHLHDVFRVLDGLNDGTNQKMDPTLQAD